MATLDSLTASLQASKKLIDLDRNGVIDKVRDNLKEKNKLDGNLLENASFQPTELPMTDISNIDNVNEAMFKKSKLPKEIIESIKKNPLVDPVYSSVVTDEYTSRFDELSSKIGKPMKETKSKKRVIKEVVNVSDNGVDYDVIKDIVENTIKKYMGAIKKTIISESRQVANQQEPLQIMKLGKTFSFIDGKGNLYEAKLKFIKNVRQQ